MNNLFSVPQWGRGREARFDLTSFCLWNIFCWFPGIWIPYMNWVPLLPTVLPLFCIKVESTTTWEAKPLYLFATLIRGLVVWTVLYKPVTAVVRFRLKGINLGCSCVLLYFCQWCHVCAAEADVGAKAESDIEHLALKARLLGQVLLCVYCLWKWKFVGQTVWLVWLFLVWDHTELSTVLKWPDLWWCCKNKWLSMTHNNVIL